MRKPGSLRRHRAMKENLAGQAIVEVVGIKHHRPSFKVKGLVRYFVLWLLFRTKAVVVLHISLKQTC